MFADDTSLYTSNNDIKNLIEIGNQELSNIDNWLIANKLAINPTKTKYMIFHTPNMSHNLPHQTPQLLMRNTPLEKVTEVRFLGLIVDQNLSWKSHMNYLLTKIRCGFSIVCKIKPFLNQISLQHLYHSLICSHIQYCIINWHHGNKSILDKLKKTCTNFARLMLNIKSNKLTLEKMTENNILTIKQMHKKSTALFMFKQIKGLNPPTMDNIFQTNQSQYKTRSNSKIIVKPCSTKLSQQSISSVGPSIWNSLDPKLKNTEQSIKSFTKNLSKYLLNEQLLA